MKNKFLLSAILLITTLTVAFASQNRKVLIIGIDGARSDALQQANTPNLDALIAGGLYTYDAYVDPNYFSGNCYYLYACCQRQTLARMVL